MTVPLLLLARKRGGDRILSGVVNNKLKGDTRVENIIAEVIASHNIHF